MDIKERIESLKRGVAYGLENGKKNMIVDLDVLVAIIIDEQKAINLLTRCWVATAYFENILETGDTEDIEKANDKLRKAYLDAFQELTGKTISEDQLDCIVNDF